MVRRRWACSTPGDFATGCWVGRRGIARESQRFPGRLRVPPDRLLSIGCVLATARMAFWAGGILVGAPEPGSSGKCRALCDTYAFVCDAGWRRSRFSEARADDSWPGSRFITSVERGIDEISAAVEDARKPRHLQGVQGRAAFRWAAAADRPIRIVCGGRGRLLRDGPHVSLGWIWVGMGAAHAALPEGPTSGRRRGWVIPAVETRRDVPDGSRDAAATAGLCA
jgi:hypothetical protein